MVDHYVPQSLDAMDRDLVRVNRIRERHAAIDAKLEQDIARLRERAAAKKQPGSETEAKLLRGARAFLSSHRDELIRQWRKKSTKLERSGWNVGWRWVAKVVITGKEAPIVAALERGGHHDFVIVKKKPNRRALGMRPDIVKKIRGLRLDRREALSVEPPKKDE